jgi:hypothetical protein
MTKRRIPDLRLIAGASLAFTLTSCETDKTADKPIEFNRNG